MAKSHPLRCVAGVRGLLSAGVMFRHYRFIDFATQTYLAFTGLLALWGAVSGRPIWLGVALGHAGVILAVHLLVVAHGVGRARGTVLNFLRHLYPVLLYTAVYHETGHLTQLFTTGYYDPVLIRWEERWFGGQPSLDWMVRWPSPLLGEVMYLAYFSFYLMIVGVAVALYVQDLRRFDHYVSVLSFVFYGCYAFYVFVPVVGPRLFFGEFNGYRLPAEVMPAEVPPVPEAIQGGAFFQIMAVIYRYLQTPGAAFPSSHVAVAWCTVWFSFRYLRKIRWVHAVMAFLLSLSTIYCRYHYAVDVFAGVATAALLVSLGNYWHRRFAREPAQTGRV